MKKKKFFDYAFWASVAMFVIGFGFVLGEVQPIGLSLTGIGVTGCIISLLNTEE
jgi:hypothetical protein